MQNNDTVWREWCDLLGQTDGIIRTRCAAAKRVGRSGVLGALGGDREAQHEALAIGQAWVDALAAEVKLGGDLDALEAQMDQDRVEQQ